MAPIGRRESDLVQPSILRCPRSLVINGLGYFPKKESINITPKFFFFLIAHYLNKRIIMDMYVQFIIFAFMMNSLLTNFYNKNAII